MEVRFNEPVMKKSPYKTFTAAGVLAGLVFLGQTGLNLACGAEGEELEVSEILDNTLKTMSRPRPEGLQFYQTKRTEKYDSDGSREETRLEKFLIETEEGEYTADLVQVNGKTATEADKKETERRMTRLAPAREEEPDSEEEVWDSEKMLQRFEIDLIGKRNWQGRDVFQLDFKPRSDYSGSSLRDKFLSKIQGRVYVDCEEFEIAKLQIRLTGEIDVWKGLLGKARKLKVDLERTRLAPGIWAEQKVETQVDFRMLFKTTREKSWIESHDFQLTNSGESEDAPIVE